MFVARSLYLDLTGQQQLPILPREGRRWMIKDYDLISTYCYFREGSLKLGDWMRSFKGLEEGAWFSWKDLLPFFIMAGRLIRRFIKGLGKKSHSFLPLTLVAKTLSTRISTGRISNGSLPNGF